MTDVLEDTTVLDSLDFPEPCVAYPGCQNPAAWRWICELCGFTGPACQTHKVLIEETTRTVVLAGGHLACSGCKKNVEEHYRWEPVKR